MTDDKDQQLTQSWGDIRQPSPQSEKTTPEPGPTVERDPRASLRDDIALHRMQALHTPFKAVESDEYRRLEAQAQEIERRFVTDAEVKEYAAEVYGNKRSARRPDEVR